MRAELATMMHVPSWSEIVREVEPLSGSMPDYEGNINRRSSGYRLLRSERRFKERTVRRNPERFALRLHCGRRTIGN
jgi:hypothetical protein